MVIFKPYKWNLSKIRRFVQRRRGRCISKIYVNPRTKMIWQCGKGHIWETTFDSIRRGSWCLQCRKNRPLTIEDMRVTAKEREGQCLSAKYINSQSKLKWNCAEGHLWWAAPNNIRQGEWCPKCGAKKSQDNKRLSNADMAALARRKGGKCLSKEYLGIDTKLKWQCAKGHIWEATPYMVKTGYWCRICSGHPRITLEEMKRIAKKRGGKCLSLKYVNDSAKIKWICTNGHIWYATANNIRQGKWCQVCSGSRSEREVRAYFEQIFGAEFPISYPIWLQGDRGKAMQLDGYNERLKLAFEYQGKQHYQYSGYYHTKISLIELKERDALKSMICKENGVLLIQIPYYIKSFALIPYLRRIFKKERRRFPMLSKNFKVDLSKIYSPELLAYVQELAIKRGGRCLSKDYIDARTALKWQCSKGHVWKTAPTNIKSGSWCPECSNVKRKTVNDAIKLAKLKGGEFLSTRFRTVNSKYLWRCPKGHVWKTQYSSIRAGTWCPTCAKRKYLSIDYIQQIAKERGGKCLSKKYVNSKTILVFQCKKRHIWKTKPQNITAGHWCPKCAENRKGATQRLTIQLMQRIAQKRGGQCLSKTYKNARTKLKWQCDKGHIWKSVPYSIKIGCWCPVCAIVKRSKQ